MPITVNLFLSFLSTITCDSCMKYECYQFMSVNDRQISVTVYIIGVGFVGDMGGRGEAVRGGGGALQRTSLTSPYFKL